mgnify:CR=1 FL=1
MRTANPDLHSSMERLKAASPLALPKPITIFTFQYGEIKRQRAVQASTLCTTFTFQYGEIKRVALSAAYLM